MGRPEDGLKTGSTHHINPVGGASQEESTVLNQETSVVKNWECSSELGMDGCRSEGSCSHPASEARLSPDLYD